RFLAGGTDLVVLARKARAPLPEVMIALHRIDELQGVRGEPDGSLRIGAGTSHAVLESHPIVVRNFTALADGSALVGSPATRHVGTLGGNLCNASPAMETGSPLLVFGASAEVAGPVGTRTLRVAELFVGPGKTALELGELLTTVTIPGPASALAGAAALGSAYVRLDYRQAMEIAVVGVAAFVALGGDGRVAGAALAITAVAPTCVLVPAVGEALAGREPSDGAIREAADLAAEVARPIDDVRAPADYRRAMVPVIARRALSFALRRARGDGIGVPATLAITAADGSSEVA
ncbi:MAG: FAD binding domain-containing protein, partial [Actinomycetota bacterium]